MIDDVIVDIAQLSQADIVFAEHVEKHDPKREDVRFEAVDALLDTRGILLGRCESQGSHACRQFAEHCAF